MNKTIVWATTFREFRGSENDNIQRIFLNSLKRVKNCNIILCCTTFGENNVYGEVMKLFHNAIVVDRKENLPEGARYSQTLVFDTGLQVAKSLHNVDAVMWSTCDILMPVNFIQSLDDIVWNEPYIVSSHPHISIKPNNDCIMEPQFSGFDLVMFTKPNLFLKQIMENNLKYPNFGWGKYEHFLLAMGAELKLNKINNVNKSKIVKFSNDVESTKDSIDKIKEEDLRNAHSLQRYLKEKGLTKYFFDLSWCSTWLSGGFQHP